ncbi:MAG: hypothetical protein ABIG95_03930 [Candidatus Woesearchaeota archaeon]
MHNPIHVGVKEPVGLRRDLLESARDTITVLQSYESYKDVRKVKKEEIQTLRRIMHEIAGLNKKLHSLVPKTAPVKEKRPEKRVKVAKPVKSHIDKLEAQLSNIEAALSGLK